MNGEKAMLNTEVEEENGRLLWTRKEEKIRKNEKIEEKLKKIPYTKNLVNNISSKGIDSEWFSITSKITSKIKV